MRPALGDPALRRGALRPRGGARREPAADPSRG